MKSFKQFVTEADVGKDRRDRSIYLNLVKREAELEDSINTSKTAAEREKYRKMLLAIRRDMARMMFEEAPYTPRNDYEGEMASSELRNIIDNAKDIESMLKPTTKLEAWVQSKITKANDYINSVRDYLKNTPGSVEEALDPIGREDADINNDGVVDGTDKYLANRRAAIADAIRNRKGSKSTESGELRAIVSRHGKPPMGRAAADQAEEFQKELERIKSRHST